MFLRWFLVFLFLLICAAVRVEGVVDERRQYHSEFKQRAQAAHDPARTYLVHETLSSAAGVYHNKTRALELGLTKTVMITVIQYAEKSYYKLFLFNLLCFTRHHGIDLVVYIIHHGLKDWESEVKSYAVMGVKVLPYPDELFWSLLYSKPNEIRYGPGRGDYESKTPSFGSHGALVMLVPVLEVLLTGYNTIFIDVDVALVLDPIPLLTRGESDFVASLEMRSCPDTYTSTFLNTTSAAAKNRARDTERKEVNSMNSVNWYTIEPNTGIMHVRSTEAGIGFYTTWLLRIIKNNEMNDQKALIRDPGNTLHSTDCVYGTDPAAAQLYEQRTSKGRRGHGIGQSHHHPHAQGHANNGGHSRLRHRWAANYTALVEDAAREHYSRPARFCFVSELLFQNGQTAFACGVKPSFKDAYILEMYRNGLESPQMAEGLLHNTMRPNNEPTPYTPRLPVTIHANFCDKKTHELNVRGLWLVTHDTADVTFGDATCRAYDPYRTDYATRNWTAEYLQVHHKRDYMYETFVQPGKLIQSTNALEVYLVDDQRRKQLIPDGDTFIARVGGDKWGEVRFLPQPLIDMVPTGPPIPSVKREASQVESQVAELAQSPGAAAAHPAVTPPTSPHARTIPGSGSGSGSAPPFKSVALKAPVAPAYASATHKAPPNMEDIMVGMLVRSESAQAVYFIDKHQQKRRVSHMGAFNRLFGPARMKDIVIISNALLAAIPEGEPLI